MKSTKINVVVPDVPNQPENQALDKKKQNTASSSKRRSLAFKGKGFAIMTHNGVSMHENEIRKDLQCKIEDRPIDVIDDFEDAFKMSPDDSIAKCELLHSNVITALAISSDGMRIAYGSVQTKPKTPIFIKNVKADEKIEVQHFTNMISDLVFSSDDAELAAADYSGEVAIISTDTGEIMACYNIKRTALCVAYLKFDFPESSRPLTARRHSKSVKKSTPRTIFPDHATVRILAIGDQDGKVAIFWPTLKEKEVIRTNSMNAQVKEVWTQDDPEINSPPKTTLVLGYGAVFDVALACSGRSALLAIATDSGKVNVYNVFSLPEGDDVLGNAINHVLEVEFTERVQCLAWSSNGQFLAAGSRDKSVQFVQLNRLTSKETGEDDWDWEQVTTFYGKDQVSGLSLSEDGSVLAIGDDARFASLYCTVTGAFLNEYRRSDRIKRVALSADGRYLAVGGFDFRVCVYDSRSGITISSCTAQPKLARSVSLALNGRRMAVSNLEFNIVVYDVHEGEVLCSFHRDKEVYVVALSDDGSILAAAGYDNTCKLYDVDQQTCLNYEFKHSAFIWAVAFLHNKDIQKIAVGDWTGLVVIYNSTNGQRLSSLKIEDRVFSLSITRDGKTLAVGGRNRLAGVYDISIPTEDPKPVHIFWQDDRVYTVAISPKGSFLAAGGVDKLVTIYELKNGLLLSRFSHTATINYLTFSLDGDTLAAVGADQKVTLYCMAKQQPCLILPQLAEVTSVSFSESGVMAFTAGFKVIVYGKSKFSFSIRDRLTFSSASTLLDSPEALKVLVQNHPTIVNALHPTENKSILQMAVEKGNDQAVSLLLGSGVQIGLFKDQKGDTPVSIAVRYKKKGILKQILTAVLDKRISNMPGSMSAIFENTLEENTSASTNFMMTTRSTLKPAVTTMTVFKAIGEAFPDMLLFFLSRLKEEECEQYVIGSLTEAHVHEPLYIACSKRVPCDIWHPYLEKQHLKQGFRVVVKANRVPVKDFAAALPLKDITHYAEQIDNYEVFAEDSVISAIIRFKWHILGKVFQRQFMIYLVYWSFSVTWSSLAAYDATETWEGLVHDSFGIGAIVLCPFTLAGSLYFMHVEMGQMFGEAAIKDPFDLFGRIQTYFLSGWNVLDLPAYALMLISLALFFARHEFVSDFAAVGCLFLTLKILFFVRAFGQWGRVVRTLLKITSCVGHTIGIICVLVLAYGLCFMVLLGCPQTIQNPAFVDPWIAFISTWQMVYGVFDPISDLLSDQAQGLVIMLWVTFMLIVVIALMNILVANMSDAYAEVQQNATLETQLELAKIITELEESQKFQTHAWLHCLKPVTSEFSNTQLSLEDSYQILSERQQKIEGKVDQISQQLQAVLSKLDSLSILPGTNKK